MSNSTHITTVATTVSESNVKEYPTYAFVLVECVYIILAVAAVCTIHFMKLLKDDRDAVTIHHKIHAEMIGKQEKDFVEQQQRQQMER